MECYHGHLTTCVLIKRSACANSDIVVSSIVSVDVKKCLEEIKMPLSIHQALILIMGNLPYYATMNVIENMLSEFGCYTDK